MFFTMYAEGFFSLKLYNMHLISWIVCIVDPYVCRSVQHKVHAEA